MVAFDSRCVNCTRNGIDVACRQKPGFCARGRECYNIGEQYGDNVCGKEDEFHSLHRVPTIDGMDMPEDDNMWIIAAIIMPVVFLVILVILAILIIKKRWCRAAAAAPSKKDGKRPRSASRYSTKNPFGSDEVKDDDISLDASSDKVY